MNVAGSGFRAPLTDDQRASVRLEVRQSQQHQHRPWARPKAV